MGERCHRILTIGLCPLKGGQTVKEPWEWTGMWVGLIMDLGSDDNKVDRPVDPRGGSTSCPELICRRQLGSTESTLYSSMYKVGITSERKAGQRILRDCE